MGPAEQQLAYSEYLSRNQREWVQTGLKIGELATNARMATRQQELREEMFEFEKEQQPQKSRLINTQINSLEQRMQQDSELHPLKVQEAVLAAEEMRYRINVADAVSEYLPGYLKVLGEETSENRRRVKDGLEPEWSKSDGYFDTRRFLADSAPAQAARNNARLEIRSLQQYGIGETQELTSRIIQLRSDAEILKEDPNNAGLVTWKLVEADKLEEQLRNRRTGGGASTRMPVAEYKYTRFLEEKKRIEGDPTIPESEKVGLIDTAYRSFVTARGSPGSVVDTKAIDSEIKAITAELMAVVSDPYIKREKREAAWKAYNDKLEELKRRQKETAPNKPAQGGTSTDTLRAQAQAALDRVNAQYPVSDDPTAKKLRENIRAEFKKLTGEDL